MATEQSLHSNQIFNIPEGNVRDYIDGKIRKETPEEHLEIDFHQNGINVRMQIPYSSKT